jgi:S-phase kinase-associated protein 1
MRDIYCRATGGAMPPAANGRAIATRHVRLATGSATSEDAESLVEACVAAMEDGGALSGEQLSFTACVLRTALVSTMQQKRSSTPVRTRILAAAAQSAGRAKRETQAALERGVAPGGAVDALRDADVALARHAAKALQLSLLGIALEVENWFALPAIAAVTQEALAGLGGALDAVLDAAGGDEAAILAAANLRAALRPEATADPAAWLIARRDARDGQALASLVPDVGLIVDEDASGEEADAAAEGAEEKEAEPKHAPAAVVVPLPRSVYSRCTIVQALARGSLALHGAPPPGTQLLLRAPGVTSSVMAHVNAAGASMEATEANGVWPDQHAIPFTGALDNSSLFGAILAANALGFQTLLGATTTAVARMMAGKSPEKIRRMFDIKNDFTPEEEEAVRQENQCVPASWLSHCPCAF